MKNIVLVKNSKKLRLMIWGTVAIYLLITFGYIQKKKMDRSRLDLQLLSECLTQYEEIYHHPLFTNRKCNTVELEIMYRVMIGQEPKYNPRNIVFTRFFPWELATFDGHTNWINPWGKPYQVSFESKIVSN